jgi:hypothetical protein
MTHSDLAYHSAPGRAKGQPGLRSRVPLRGTQGVRVRAARHSHVQWRRGLATRRLYSGIQFKLQRVAVSISVFQTSVIRVRLTQTFG